MSFRVPEGRDAVRARRAATAAVRKGIARIDRNRRERERLVQRLGDPPKPWIYLIVATGDIYEDIPQAQNAPREGVVPVAPVQPMPVAPVPPTAVAPIQVQPLQPLQPGIIPQQQPLQPPGRPLH